MSRSARSSVYPARASGGRPISLSTASYGHCSISAKWIFDNASSVVSASSKRYAPTPQAKGKIERLHDFWQKRLPSLFAAEQVTTLPAANPLIEQLRLHHNTHEKHREIGTTPQAAWNLAAREKRSVLQAAPTCPWWPYIWSQRTQAKVEPDGRISVAGQRLRIDRPPGSKVIRCLHPNGDHSILAASPAKEKSPVLLMHCPAPAAVLL